MDYRIETKEAFQVFGIEGVFKSEGLRPPTVESGPVLNAPSDLWDNSHKDGEYNRLEKNAGDLPAFVPQNLCKVHGVCSYRETETDSFPYMLCAFRNHNSTVEGYKVVDIPAHTWAIFPSGMFDWDDCGTVMESLYKRFFGEWLPTSDYEQVGSLDMELYGGDGDLGYVEIWFAVRKKS